MMENLKLTRPLTRPCGTIGHLIPAVSYDNASFIKHQMALNVIELDLLHDIKGKDVSYAVSLWTGYH